MREGRADWFSRAGKGNAEHVPQAIVDIIVPLFAIMLAGYLAGRAGLLSESASDALNRFVFTVSFPALVFISLSKVSVSDFFNWPFLAVLGGGMLVTFLASIAVARLMFPASLTALALHGLTAMFSSTAYIGVPLILIAFGNEALVPAIIGAVITGLVFFPLAVVLAEIDKGRARWRLYSASFRARPRATDHSPFVSSAFFNIA